MTRYLLRRWTNKLLDFKELMNMGRIISINGAIGVEKYLYKVPKNYGQDFNNVG
jgi:hypothetical protein